MTTYRLSKNSNGSYFQITTQGREQPFYASSEADQAYPVSREKATENLRSARYLSTVRGFTLTIERSN